MKKIGLVFKGFQRWRAAAAAAAAGAARAAASAARAAARAARAAARTAAAAANSISRESKLDQDGASKKLQN